MSVVGTVVKALVIVVLLVLVVPYLVAPFYRFGRPVSTPMLWRWATGAPVNRSWVAMASISPALPVAVLAAEDSRFCQHHGIDWRELREIVHDAGERGELRGGSTITQQTAKNLFLWQGRSVVRKALEFPLALWIDLVLPKRRIAELYLNVAEWGPNGQFGAEAGARHAFGKSARDLNLREAALLASVLPNPVTRKASRPGPGVIRLASIYQARARRSAMHDACVLRHDD
jgi:monofunctional glycosyltransferase